MFARLLSLGFLLGFSSLAFSQCGQWYPYPPVIIVVPVYPVPGKPTPVARPAPPVARNGAVRETTTGPGAEPLPKKMDAPSKPRESTAIPKLKPPLPDDLAAGATPPKKPMDEAQKVDQYLVPADEKQSRPGPQVRVGFFNHSDREILLVVSGEQVKLPPEQYVTMRLTRTFTWAERDGKAREVVVPPDADGVEIVFRK